MLLKQEQANDRELFEAASDEDERDFYHPVFLAAAGQKQVMTQLEYEEFMVEQEEALLRQVELDSPEQASNMLGEDDDEDAVMHQSKEMDNQIENDVYDEVMSLVKQDVTRGISEETVFSQYKVTNDVAGLKKLFAEEDRIRLLAKGALYADEDEDVFTEGFAENTLDNTKITKEDTMEFEEVWEQTTRDIYSTTNDDLKSQYDHARLIIKLNQQLRQRLVSSTKQTRQLLNQTLKLKEKVVKRVASSSKDFQGDVLPQKAFDFIRQDKQLQKRIQDSQGNK